MHKPEKNPETLVSVPNEFEAAMIVSALAAHDIDATTTGNFTSGFKAEAPGDVKVLVRQSDLMRAKRLLNDLSHQTMTAFDPASHVARHSSSGSVASSAGGSLYLLEMLILMIIVAYLLVRLIQWF